MIPKDSNSFSDGGDWEEPEELGWSEADWERYLVTQDELLLKYLSTYEQLPQEGDRIEQLSKLMRWPSAQELLDDDAEEDEDDDEEDDEDDTEPYTVQRNPAFIASSALYLLLARSCELLAPPEPAALRFAVGFMGSLSRGERQTLLAVHSLDLGDFTLSVCQFKRALRELNVTMSLVTDVPSYASQSLLLARREAMARLFDLRELLLRGIRECRDEIARRPKEEDGDDDDRAPGSEN